MGSDTGAIYYRSRRREAKEYACDPFTGAFDDARVLVGHETDA
jgi:hypothetical protein